MLASGRPREHIYPRSPPGRSRRVGQVQILSTRSLRDVGDLEELLFPTRKERFAERRKERAHRDVRDEVFDRATLLAVSRLVSHGYLREVDHSISTGKEANVFRVTTKDGFAALKVYRITNALFRRWPEYALEELRREVGGGSFARLVFAWARREHTALQDCHEAGVHVPRPLVQYRNLLLMEFLGEEGIPSPPLVQVRPEDPARTLDQLAEDCRRMMERAGRVHGDLSPYNVIYHKGRPYLIDLGQTLPRDHPQALELLRRDAAHLAKYFSRLGVSVDPEELYGKLGGTP